MSANEPVRRVVLIEIDSTRQWSSAALTEYLNERIPELRPVVFGAMAGSEVDGAYRKLRQLSREVEQRRPTGDLIHSAHKALSFFQDMIPDRLWSWWMVGEPHEDRKRLGAAGGAQ